MSYLFMNDDYVTGNSKLDKAISVAFFKDPLKPNRMQRLLTKDDIQLTEEETNKYHVSEKIDRTYKDGTVFASKKEMERWDYLLNLQNAGEIRDLERQIPFELVEGFISRQWGEIRLIIYIADFVYFDVSYRRGNSGRRCVEDSKGMRTSEYKLKRKLFLYKYGNVLFFEV